MYTMHRTQLYLDEELWHALRLAARHQGLTVSELVRRAAREKYLGGVAGRHEAMLGWIGTWRDRPDLDDTQTHLRSLRRGQRLDRLPQ